MFLSSASQDHSNFGNNFDTNLLNTTSYFLVSPGTIRNNLNFLSQSMFHLYLKVKLSLLRAISVGIPHIKSYQLRQFCVFLCKDQFFVSFSKLLSWLRTPYGNGSVDSVYVWLGGPFGVLFPKGQTASFLALSPVWWLELS